MIFGSARAQRFMTKGRNTPQELEQRVMGILGRLTRGVAGTLE